MEPRTNAILEEALILPESDRAKIAGALLESLEVAEEPAAVEDAWRQEVAARVAARDAGEVAAIPWETVREELFARLSERRPD